RRSATGRPTAPAEVAPGNRAPSHRQSRSRSGHDRTDRRTAVLLRRTRARRQGQGTDDLLHPVPTLRPLLRRRARLPGAAGWGATTLRRDRVVAAGCAGADPATRRPRRILILVAHAGRSPRRRGQDVCDSAWSALRGAPPNAPALYAGAFVLLLRPNATV